MSRTTETPGHRMSRPLESGNRRIPQGLWITLAASLVILGAHGAEAAEATLDPMPEAALILASAHLPPPRIHANFGVAPGLGTTPEASPVRLVMSAGRLSKPVVEGGGPGHRNPFTLVGNRTGLENVAQAEVRNGETWLVPGSVSDTPVREIGLASFQGGGSYIASR